MTDFGSFHLGSGECVLLAGRSRRAKSRLLKETGRRDNVLLASTRLFAPGFLTVGRYLRNSRVAGALKLMGFRRKPQTRLRELSASERMELAIASALARKVDALRLDNPTRDLDPENRQLLLQALRNLARQSGMAVLFTSNDLSDALAVAHRVLALTPAGKLLESTPDTREETLRAAYPLLQL